MELAQQKSHLFLWVPVFFAVGIGLYFGLKSEPPLLLGLCLSLFFVGESIYLSKIQDRSNYHKGGFFLMIAFSLIFLGFSVAQLRTHLVDAPMLIKKISPVGITGTIESIEPLGQKKGSRVILAELDIERIKPSQTPRKIRLSVRKDQGLRAGQQIKLLAGLNPPSPPVAPSAFDFQRMMFFKQIGGVGFAYTAPEILKETNRGVWLENLRQSLSQKIQKHVSKPQGSVLVALMTGQRAAIQGRDWNALRASGLAHLLAISGLHVGMVAGVLFFFSRLLFAAFPNVALKYPIKKWAALIALAGATFYTVMVGGSVPTQRALIMTGLVMLAILFDRSPLSLRLVALAAMVVLFFTPESLTSVSFQMSFAAVTALICFYNYIRPLWIGVHRQAGFIRRVALYLVGVSLTTLVAGTATGLFALYHFQNFALYGMLANMIAVPLMAFVVMPVTVLSYLFMLVGLEGLSLPIAEWGVSWILATAHWVSGLSGALWLVPSWPQWIFILMVLSIWTWMVWQGRFRRAMILLFIILTGLVFLYKQPDILISSKVDLVSLRHKDGSLWFSSGRKERFTAKNWLRRNGQNEKDKKFWPREGAIKDFPLACDNYGCRGEVSGQKIAIAFSNRAWQEDCAWADLIISQTPVPYKKCQADYVIDYFDVWREGVHAIWLNRHSMKIKTVEEVRGNRPWTQTSANRKKKD